MIILESTTYPGTTEEVLQPILEAGGLRNVLMNAVEAATRRSRELGEDFLRKL